MKKEIKRFYAALKAKTTQEDETFLRKYLKQEEQVLFYRQRTADQRHALNTAYRITLELKGSSSVNKSIAIKSALMHDIGKSYVFMPIWIRPIVVILEKTLPSLLNLIANQGAKKQSLLFFRYFYIYKNHPLIGEKMLQDIGTEKEVCDSVRLHHEPPAPKEPKELPYLRRADLQE